MRWQRFFEEIPETRLIPGEYLQAIVRFFEQDRSFFVDPSDVAWFFRGGMEFMAVKSIDELTTLSAQRCIRRILAHGGRFDSLAKMDGWMTTVSGLVHDKDGGAVFLAHVATMADDNESEWYVACYR